MPDRAAKKELSPNEIEITPESVEAGVRALALCESYDPPRSTVTSIHRAMEVARLATPRREPVVCEPIHLPSLSELGVPSETLAKAEEIAAASDVLGVETWRLEFLIRVVAAGVLSERGQALRKQNT